jgi:transposase
MIISFPDRKRPFERGKAVKQLDKPYLSTEDVAQLLGFSVRTVTLWFNKWHETGGLEGIPGFKVGKSWRADHKEIDAWIEKQKMQKVPVCRHYAER